MSIEDYLDGNEISHRAAVDLSALREFCSEHDKHTTKSPDPCGSDYSFRYSPCSCGTSVYIRCPCGTEKDITHYSDW